MAHSKIFHLHIPKTGGTAIREYLVSQLGSGYVAPMLGGVRLSDALVQWEHKQVLSGHVSFHQGDKLPSGYFSIAVLRDPIDRFLSELFYEKYQSPEQLRDTRVRLSTLDSHIEAVERRRRDLASPQLAMLYPLGTSQSAELDLDQKLAAAKSALDLFDLVGVQEELEDFASMLAAEMGWPQKTLPLSNRTLKRISVEGLDPTQRRRMEDVLAAEIDLYEYARTRFRADRRRYIAKAATRTADPVPASASQPITRAIAPVADLPELKNFGDKRCEIVQASVRGGITGALETLCGEPISIDIEFIAHEPVENITVGIAIRDERGALLFGTNSLLLGDAIDLDRGRYLASFTMLNRLGRGHYSVDVSLINHLSHHDGCYHWIDQATRFEVYDSTTNYFEGRIMLDPDLKMSVLDDAGEIRRSTPQTGHANVRSFGRVNPSLSEFRAAIEVLSPLQALPAATDSIVSLRLRNLGGETWPAGGRAAPVCLSYRWYSTSGEMLVADGKRSMLPADVASGQAIIAPLLVQAPDAPGTYALAISLVQEGVAWFVEQNPDSVCQVDVEVA